MSHIAVASALSLYVESTVLPTESTQLLAVGDDRKLVASRWICMVAATTAWMFVFAMSIGLRWFLPLQILAGAAAGTVVWLVGSRLCGLQRLGLRGVGDAFVGVGVTDRRFVCVSTGPRGRPAVVVDRPRDEIRAVRIGTARLNWILGSCTIMAIDRIGAPTIELASGSDVDGVRSMFRIAGLPVQDLDGTPCPRPSHESGAAAIDSLPRVRPSSSRWRACIVLAVMIWVAALAGGLAGRTLAQRDMSASTRSVVDACWSQVIGQVGLDRQVIDGSVRSTTRFGAGLLIVGTADVVGPAGAHEVDFSCVQGRGGLQVALSG